MLTLRRLALRKIRSDEERTLEMTAFDLLVMAKVRIINSVDKTSRLYNCSPVAKLVTVLDLIGVFNIFVSQVTFL